MRDICELVEKDGDENDKGIKLGWAWNRVVGQGREKHFGEGHSEEMVNAKYEAIAIEKQLKEGNLYISTSCDYSKLYIFYGQNSGSMSDGGLRFKVIAPILSGSGAPATRPTAPAMWTLIPWRPPARCSTSVPEDQPEDGAPAPAVENEGLVALGAELAPQRQQIGAS
ncbi:hypothetical protein Fmac_011534 [Flemingia macrophylla]|uniref:Uncharacterized protein n=1 Tax=Flemingia macrophylla TaxID=520843 RepID=A0ABD1MMP9_9FABA